MFHMWGGCLDPKIPCVCRIIGLRSRYCRLFVAHPPVTACGPGGSFLTLRDGHLLASRRGVSIGHWRVRVSLLRRRSVVRIGHEELRHWEVWHQHKTCSRYGQALWLTQLLKFVPVWVYLSGWWWYCQPKSFCTWSCDPGLGLDNLIWILKFSLPVVSIGNCVWSCEVYHVPGWSLWEQGRVKLENPDPLLSPCYHPSPWYYYEVSDFRHTKRDGD